MKKYREFECAVCGKKVIDNSFRQNGKYCGEACNSKAYYRRKKMTEEVVVVLCKYNDGVVCDKQNCQNCGWNPEVEKMRKEQLV